MWWLIKDDELEWLELTKERRKTFNELVLKINEVIEEAIEEAQKKVDYTLVFSNWDKWPYEAVDGLFCSPNSSGRYPDSEQPDLHFFKFDTTRPNVRPNDEWKKRSLKPLSKRSLAPKVPDCPGDGPPDEEKDLEAIEGEEISEDLSMGTPDSFGKIFHPNELGHLTIASFCLSAAMEYFDGPNQFGHEWLAAFNTPGLVNSRCFKNNKVVFAAHGFTDGCEGDDF